MDLIRGLTLVLVINLLGLAEAQAQDYLVLDRYGTKRIRIPVGSEIQFKLKGDKRLYSNYLTQLVDSVVILGNHDIYLKLEDFDSFWFPRKHWRSLRYATMIPAAGFLLGAAVHPLVEEPFYDPGESALTGLAILGLGQSFRLLEWKRFKINKNSRIWVGGNGIP